MTLFKAFHTAKVIKMVRGLAPLLLLVASIHISGCTKHEESGELVIGFNPVENVDTVEANGKELAKILKEKTGLTLKTFVASDFGALIEALRAGRVQFAFLPPFSLIQGEKVSDAKVLLKAVRKGRDHFYSAIITSKDFKTIQDLKGKTIAWTDPSSASGHIMAKSALMDLGIDPDTFFSKQVFAGAHDALVLSVINKTVDAGATFSNNAEGTDGAWQQFVKDPEQNKSVHALLVSKPIPGDTLSTSNKFYSTHKELVDKVVGVMMQLSATDEGKKILKDLYHIDSMVPAKSEDYEPLRQAARRLKIGDI